jgi:hypothetical protein
MKKYYVIHRNFVYHTEKQIPIHIVPSNDPITPPDASEYTQEIEKKTEEVTQQPESVEPCDAPECIGGVQSDYHGGLWFLFDQSREDLCDEIRGRFPTILENDIPAFIEWSSHPVNYNKTIFQHMLIDMYSNQFSPNFTKLIVQL